MDAQELERLSNELRRNYIEPPNWGSMRAMLNCLETLVEEFKSRYRLGNKASKAASSQADAHKIAQLREQIAFYDRKIEKLKLEIAAEKGSGPSLDEIVDFLYQLKTKIEKSGAP